MSLEDRVHLRSNFKLLTQDFLVVGGGMLMHCYLQGAGSSRPARDDERPKAFACAKPSKWTDIFVFSCFRSVWGADPVWCLFTSFSWRSCMPHHVISVKLLNLLGFINLKSDTLCLSSKKILIFVLLGDLWG